MLSHHHCEGLCSALERSPKWLGPVLRDNTEQESEDTIYTSLPPMMQNLAGTRPPHTQVWFKARQKRDWTKTTEAPSCHKHQRDKPLPGILRKDTERMCEEAHLNTQRKHMAQTENCPSCPTKVRGQMDPSGFAGHYQGLL